MGGDSYTGHLDLALAMVVSITQVLGISGLAREGCSEKKQFEKRRCSTGLSTLLILNASFLFVSRVMIRTVHKTKDSHDLHWIILRHEKPIHLNISEL